MADNGIPESSASSARPLKILIAGAGIGGLCAAIALRQQGHHVEIFEQSRMAQETGAAIHIAPNCNGLLKRLGMDARKHGSVEMYGITQYEPCGKVMWSMDLREVNKMWQHPWDLIHRAHLHSALKDLALSQEGEGQPAELHLSTGVESVDPSRAIVKLANGTEVQGDLVIGADGVHSKTRKMIPGGNLSPFDSGKTAFRFLIPTETIAADPVARPILQHENHLIMWVGNDRRIVMYPCVGGAQMNFVAIFPSVESSSSTGSDWQQTGNKDLMLKIFSSFGENVAALLNLADGSSLKIWTLLDMAKMPSFVNQNFAVLGDAAHPFLPREFWSILSEIFDLTNEFRSTDQAQGGAQAIEDGVSLAALLPLGTTPDELQGRLQIYERQRYERSHHIQQGTRQSGADHGTAEPLDVQSFTAYNVGHDEWHSSTGALQKYLRESRPDLRWRAPTGFGPAPGPRQPLGSASGSQEVQRLRAAKAETQSTLSIRFRTSRTYVQNLLPPGFSFFGPATVCEATLSCTTLDGMTWLGGGGYSFIKLSLHGLKYVKKDGQVIAGSFIPLVIENLADPIVTGRDELGMPKLFSDIDVQTTNNGASVELSWRGTTFCKMSLQGLQDQSVVNENADPPKAAAGPPGRPPPPPEAGEFVWRHVPTVGQPGKTDAEYPVLLPKPENTQNGSDVRTKVTQNASIEFLPGSWQSLPSLYNITSVLSELPLYGVVEGKHITSSGVDDLSRAHRIE